MLQTGTNKVSGIRAFNAHIQLICFLDDLDIQISARFPCFTPGLPQGGDKFSDLCLLILWKGVEVFSSFFDLYSGLRFVFPFALKGRGPSLFCIAEKRAGWLGFIVAAVDRPVMSQQRNYFMIFRWPVLSPPFRLKDLCDERNKWGV